MSAPPYPYGPRTPRTVEFHDNGVMKRLDPRFFNAAFPDMVAPKLAVGDRVKVTGASARPVAFEIPAAEVSVHVEFGDRSRTIPLPVEQVGIEADSERVFVSYRLAFQYKVVPYEKRSCALRACAEAHPEIERSAAR